MLDLQEALAKLNKADLRLSIYQDYLAGERFSLRPMFPSDVDLQDCFTNRENMKYWGTGLAQDSTEALQTISRTANNNLSRPQTSAWSIITRDGLSGCFFAWKRPDSTAEIAYVIRPGFSGRGLMTQAGRLLLDSQLRDFEGIITATAHPDNKASQAVLEKLGLKPDPEKQNVYVPAYKSHRNYYRLIKHESKIEKITFRS